MKSLFAEQGVPQRVISENGGHLSSDAFRRFADQWYRWPYNRYSHLPSPAELLYGRRVVSNLPVATWNGSGKRCEIRARLDQRQDTVKERHDARGVTDLAELSRRHHVRTYVTRSPTDGNLVVLSKMPTATLLQGRIGQRKHTAEEPA